MAITAVETNTPLCHTLCEPERCPAQNVKISPGTEQMAGKMFLLRWTSWTRVSTHTLTFVLDSMNTSSLFPSVNMPNDTMINSEKVE